MHLFEIFVLYDIGRSPILLGTVIIITFVLFFTLCLLAMFRSVYAFRTKLRGLEQMTRSHHQAPFVSE